MIVFDMKSLNIEIQHGNLHLIWFLSNCNWENTACFRELLVPYQNHSEPAHLTV